MSADAYLLVLLSAATHAWWNFLLKRSGGSEAVVAWSKVLEAALFLPVVFLSEALRSPGVWVWPVVGAALVIGNYVFLSAAYRQGDLSVAYPISRGAMLVLLPPVAFISIGERLSVPGLAAIAVIVVGISVLGGRSRERASVRLLVYACFAALTAAAYTVWDKQAVQILSPVTYFGAYSVLVGLFYGALLARRPEWRAAWTTQRSTALQVGLLNTASYLLALTALRVGEASYVIAARQISIAMGAALGWRLLAEPLPFSRRIGIGLILAGSVLVVFAA